jgi:uncharacterized membrane protein YfcA
MDPTLGLIVCAAAFTAGFTQALAGFGSTLVALPLLAQFVPMRAAVPVCCLLALCLNAMLTCHWRLHVQTRALGVLLAASLPGVALGVLGLDRVSSGPLRVLLALAILAFVWREWRPKGPRPPAGWGFGLAAGFLAGAMGALLGVNGPPAAAWISRQGFGRDAVRGTLTAYFLLAGVVIVLSQALAGLVTARVLGLAALGLPALVAGALAGLAGCGRIGEAAFRRVLLGVLAAAGVSLLFQALL